MINTAIWNREDHNWCEMSHDAPWWENQKVKYFSSFKSVIAVCREMFDEWTVELKAMIDRIIHLRQQLYDALHDRGKAT